MKKQEINQRIHNLEEELAELKHLLDQPEERWRAEMGSIYYYTAGSGVILHDEDRWLSTDERRYKTGNYFQTEEHAKESNIYKILNDPYEYFISGLSSNFNNIPNSGYEWYNHARGSWIEAKSAERPINNKLNYRWKRI